MNTRHDPKTNKESHSSTSSRAILPIKASGTNITRSQYIPIRARPNWQPLDAEALQNIKRQQKPEKVFIHKACRIPACRRRNCGIRTHRQYQDDGSLLKRKSSNEPWTLKSFSSIPDTYQATPILIARGVSGFPAMPLPCLENKAFRALLHDFYIVLYDRINILLTPPPISKSEKDRIEKEKGMMFEVAMSNPVYCLNFIATMYHYQVLRRDYSIYDKVTATINGQLVSLLREKLNKFQPSDVDQLMLVVLTLVMFDIGQGRTTSLEFHRKAMQSLVDSCGGLHNMGRTIPYVANLDRMISLHTGKQIVYSAPGENTATFQRASHHPQVYGSFFDDPQRHGLDPETILYYQGVCRAIEILEGENWDFEPNNFQDSSEIHYFYFLRDQTANRFVILNTQYFESHGMDRCVLLISKILEYSILMNNYVTTIPIFMADKFQEAICLQDLKMVWKEREDVLRWCFFTLLSMSIPWKGHAWALQLMLGTLGTRYGDKWPKNWRRLELLNVRQFIWSERIRVGFDKSCCEIDMAIEVQQSRNP